MSNYTYFCDRSSQLLVAAEANRLGIWEMLSERVHIPQKKAGYDPIDKLKDAFITILSGGKGIVESKTLVKPEPGLYKAFGRQACADQSTISRNLSACGETQVAEMRLFLCDLQRRHGRTYRHRYETGQLILDVDMTGLQAGRKAEGSTKGYFSHEAGARGRQVGRVVASQYDEVIVDKLYPGIVQLERSLQELVLLSEKTLEFDQARRQRVLVRVDGGGGRDEDINWLLGRDYSLLIKVRNWQRSQKLLQRVHTWVRDQKDPARRIGWVEDSHGYVRPTRQFGAEDTHADGKVYRYVVTTNLSNAMIYFLNGRALPPQPDEQELLSLLMNLYDLRSGGVETCNRNSKSGLGINKRNKKSFTGQEMLVLLGQLAYLLLTWFKNRYLQASQRFAGFGLQRIVRDVLNISGRVWFTEEGELVKVLLNGAHCYAKDLILAWNSQDQEKSFRLRLRRARGKG